MRSTFDEREYIQSLPTYKEYETTVDGITVYYSEKDVVARFFYGKSKKSKGSYRYANLEKMICRIEDRIKEQFDRNVAKEERKKSDAIMAKENRSKVKVGDVFHTSWGYENTHVEYFQVVAKRTATQVLVRQIGQTQEDNGFMSGRAKCTPDIFIGEIKKCTIDKYGNLVKADEYGHNAYPGNIEDTHHVSWGY